MPDRVTGTASVSLFSQFLYSALQAEIKSALKFKYMLVIENAQPRRIGEWPILLPATSSKYTWVYNCIV
jgi:hypothetical protein